MNIDIDMLHNLSYILNITNGYHSNQEKGITMVTAAKINILKILQLKLQETLF